MFLLDALALVIIDRKGIAIEVDRHLVEQRICKILVLQDPKKKIVR